MAVQNYSESEREGDLHAFERLSENSVWETLCLTASRKTGQKILIVRCKNWKILFVSREKY